MLLLQLIDTNSFVFTNRLNFLNLKSTFRQANTCCKAFLKIPNLLMLMKHKSSLLPRIANYVLNKGKSAVSPLYDDPKNFSHKSNLDDSGISLTAFPSGTNLKMNNISVTPKLLKKVLTDLYLSKAPGPDCIPLVVLNNCKPECSYILAKLLNM